MTCLIWSGVRYVNSSTAVGPSSGPPEDMANKDSDIKARVTPEIKNALTHLAKHRGESESVIVREAIRYYLANHASTATHTDEPISFGKQKKKVAG